MTPILSKGLLLAFLASTRILTFGAHSAIDPVPRGDQWWKDRHDSFNKRVAELGEKSQLIFIGDSITQGWEGEGKEVWAEHFAKHDAINLGIGGDRTQHVLWRFENGNLDGLKPKAAVVMIGTNNSNGEDNTAEQIAGGIRAIIQKLRTKLPSTKILLVSIFPRGENPNAQRGKILQVNQIVQKLADGENIHWIDFGHKYVDEAGQIPREIMPDYLHLSKRGYEVWAESLAKPLGQILGGGSYSASNASSSADKLKGEWIATLPGPNDEPVDLPFTIDSANGKIEGRFHAESRDLKILDGKLDGDKFAWIVKRDRPDGGTMTYKMSGTLQGAKIAGKASTDLDGNEINIEWTGRRK